jgi:hypothetical protein
MSAFRIFCRTSEISPHRHEARVFVIAESDPLEMAVRSECRVVDSVEHARSECMRMAESMKTRLARHGWSIVRVEFSA